MTSAPVAFEGLSACHLELSGLTDPGEMCSCGLPAGMHAKWKHRQEPVDPMLRITQVDRRLLEEQRVQALALLHVRTENALRDALHEEILEHAQTRRELALVEPRTIDRASTVDLIWALGERLVRRFL